VAGITDYSFYFNFC